MSAVIEKYTSGERFSEQDEITHNTYGRPLICSKKEGVGRMIHETERRRSVSRSGYEGFVWSSKTKRPGAEKPTVSVEEARRLVLDSVRSLSGETVPILEASDRILYEDIIAGVMIPAVDDSAKDGYAVISDDTRGASRTNPVRLRIIGEIRAGGSTQGKRVVRGTAIRIMTGAPIPEGADSVVQFEETDEEAGCVKVFSESVKNENCKCAGENIRKGERVLQRGDRLNSADVGMLASLNRTTVKVYRRPTVSIISTGDELAEIGDEIRRGQIRNVNAYTLYSEIKKYNAIPRYLGIARDTKQDIGAKLLEGLESNVVISTGGVSTGRYDLVKEIYPGLDIGVLFEWIDIKPGRPCTFGRRGDRLVFGLPGYPVPTLTSFIQFVRPALLKMMGARKIDKPIVDAVLDEDIENRSGTVNLMRGCFVIRNNEFHVSTTGSQKPSMLRSMSKANCLIVIPKTVKRVRAGEKVTIQLIDHDEV
jgi:molybdopterin molybdotransferase